MTFCLTAVMGLLWVALWIGLRTGGMYRAVPVARTEKAVGRWNRNLMATAAVYGLGAAPLAFGLYAAPLYLSMVLHVSQRSLGHLLWIPPAGWETGYLFWGWMADRRKKLGRGRPAGWFAGLCAAGFLIVLAPAAALTAHPVMMTMVLFYLQMFVAGGFVVLSLSDGMSAQPKENSGFLAGVAISFWALMTGVLTMVLGRLFDARAFTRGFWLVAFLPVVGFALWAALRKDNVRGRAITAGSGAI